MQKSYLSIFSFFLLSVFSGFAEETDKTQLITTLSKENDAAKVEMALLSFFKDNMATSDMPDVYQYIDHIESEDKKVHLLSWPPKSAGNQVARLIILQNNDGESVKLCSKLDLNLGIDEFTPAIPSGIFSFELVEGSHYMFQFSGNLDEDDSQYHVFQLYDAEGFVLCKSCMEHEAELILEKPAALDLKIKVISRVGRFMYQDYEWHKRKKIYEASEQVQYKLVNNVFLKVE